VRNPEDTKYVWNEKNFNIIQNSISKEKRYFIEITIKDSETLEPVRSISTSSDYPESFFRTSAISTFPHPNMMTEIHGCVDILCSIHFGNDKQFKL
jgi:hypothetical protein